MTVQGCLFILVSVVYKLNVSKDSLGSHLYCTAGYQIGNLSANFKTRLRCESSQKRQIFFAANFCQVKCITSLVVVSLSYFFYLHPYHFQGIPEEELLRQQQELFQQARIKQAQVQYMH